MKLIERFELSGKLRFSTAMHIGSGRPGIGHTDLGILLGPDGLPFIPGASLKGVFRSTAEAIAHLLGMKACGLEASSDCAGGNEDIAKESLQKIRDAGGNRSRIEKIVENNVCDVCRVFGSPLSSGRLAFSDSPVCSWAGGIEVRDGVGIDRDSGTAVDGCKYDYEVVPAGAVFDFRLEGENLDPAQEALAGAVTLEWTRGVSIGGMTSRGLGKAKLCEVEMRKVDLTDTEERKAYLLEGDMKSYSLEEIRAGIAALLEAEVENA